MQRMWYGIIHFAFFPSFFANCIARVKRFSHDMSLGCLQSHSSLARYESLLLLSIIIDINFIPMFQLVNQAIMHVNLPSANVTVLQLDVWAGTNSIRGTNIIPISYVKKKLWKRVTTSHSNTCKC